MQERSASGAVNCLYQNRVLKNKQIDCLNESGRDVQPCDEAFPDLREEPVSLYEATPLPAPLCLCFRGGGGESLGAAEAEPDAPVRGAGCDGAVWGERERGDEGREGGYARGERWGWSW